MSRTVREFHERLLRGAQTELLKPFALFLDGEEIQLLRPSRLAAGFLLTAVLVSFVLAFLDLEDTRGLNFFVSWWIWFLHSFIGLLPLALITNLARRYGLRRIPASIAALICTYPLLVIGSLLIDWQFTATDTDGIESQGLLLNILSEASEVFEAALVVWVVVAGFLFNKAVALRTGPREYDTNEETIPLNWPDCLAEVPKDKRGTLVGLTSDQHYLKVETSEGESLIRYSLNDAIALLDTIPGLHIHRSHWVALQQIQRLVEVDGTLFCEMLSGTRYPVSRRRRSQTLNLLDRK